MCNFFFCHYVFKKPSAAEASESVYMRERVKSVARWLGNMLCVVLVQDGQDTHSKVDCLLGCVK